MAIKTFDEILENNRLQHLYEELREIDRNELQKFIEQSEKDEELNKNINSMLKDLPFYQHLTTDRFTKSLSMKDLIISYYKRKDLTNYFVYNNDRYEGFVSYIKNDNIVGDFKLFKFYDDASTMVDTLELMNRMIKENHHVQFSAVITNPVNKAYGPLRSNDPCPNCGDKKSHKDGLVRRLRFFVARVTSAAKRKQTCCAMWGRTQIINVDY